MKRIYTVLASAAFATVAIPSYANNWQWQLDRIKSEQQRCIGNHLAQEQARLAREKTTAGQQAGANQAMKSVNAQPAT